MVVTGLFVANSATLWGGGVGRPRLLAHRGIAQNFPLDGVGAETCTATRIDPPTHSYLENTIASMTAAFAAGADMVEFDVQVTADGELAVFHDTTLDCRTDGTGPVAAHTLAELRRLDLGYGYTADGGRTYPLRGTGVGLLPTAGEVLAAFPGRELLIDLKNDDAAEGRRLADLLATLSEARRDTLTVSGGDAAIGVLRQRLPGLRLTSATIMRGCLVRYLAVGWTGQVPDACRRTHLRLPQRYGRYLWGRPDLFAERLREVDTPLVLVAGDGGWSEGFDDAADLAAVDDDYSGWLWTNRVDVVAPLLRG